MVSSFRMSLVISKYYIFLGPRFSLDPFTFSSNSFESSSFTSFYRCVILLLTCCARSSDRFSPGDAAFFVVNLALPVSRPARLVVYSFLAGHAGQYSCSVYDQVFSGLAFSYLACSAYHVELTVYFPYTSS